MSESQRKPQTERAKGVPVIKEKRGSLSVADYVIFLILVIALPPTLMIELGGPHGGFGVQIGFLIAFSYLAIRFAMRRWYSKTTLKKPPLHP